MDATRTRAARSGFVEDVFLAVPQRTLPKWYEMFLWLVLGVSLVALPCSWGKVYKKCELAQELLQVHGFAEDEVAEWVCIAEHESEFNTSAIGRMNWDGSEDHGLFQINDRYWCSPPGPKNVCQIDCAALEDDDITDDLDCARVIYARHGFSAWAVWKNYCRGINYSTYLSSCGFVQPRSFKSYFLNPYK